MTAFRIHHTKFEEKNYFFFTTYEYLAIRDYKKTTFIVELQNYLAKNNGK